MKQLNFLLQGFGFIDLNDLKISAFGFMLSSKVLKISSLLALVTAFTQELFGLNWKFLLAYVVLVIFEWRTGIAASLKKGEKHESRKLGRMLMKIFVYTLIIYLLNTFNKNVEVPTIFGLNIDPFNWLYWFALIVIIWQLFISVLENLDVLGYPFASKLIKVINKKIYANHDLKD